jgi:nucleoside-triphosphatase THEP1
MNGEETSMYATYHLKADELNADLIQSLKNAYHQREIVILPRDEYEEMEKARHNAAFTEELRNRIRDMNEGCGIVKTMAELEAMANE